jgi:DNA gyrase subunit B
VESDGHSEKLRGPDLGEVLCFGLENHQTRFRPIKAVIRHPLADKLFRIRTAYGRSVRVTASHSVFVNDNGAVKLKRGDQLQLGDQLVAPKTLRLPEDAPKRIDLLQRLWSEPSAAKQIWVRGPAVEDWYRHKVSVRHAANSRLNSPRVEIPLEVARGLADRRRASGITNEALCAAIGIAQPVTFYGWEKGEARPTVEHFESYLAAVGAEFAAVMPRVKVGLSRLAHTWASQYRASGRNAVKDYVSLASLNAADIEWFAEREDLELTPE